MSNPQVRLTNFLKRGDLSTEQSKPQKRRTAAKKRRRAPETSSDLLLSEEMVHWIDCTVQERDGEGYLAENISSVLAKPLDSMAVFCPTGDLITAKTTAIRPPDKPLPGTGTGTFRSTAGSYAEATSGSLSERGTRTTMGLSGASNTDGYSQGTEERELAEFENRPPEHINAAIDSPRVLAL